MNEDQAYQDGMDAYEVGKQPSDNPFPGLDSPALFDCWMMGWLDARDEDLRRTRNRR